MKHGVSKREKSGLAGISRAGLSVLLLALLLVSASACKGRVSEAESGSDLGSRNESIENNTPGFPRGTAVHVSDFPRDYAGLIRELAPYHHEGRPLEFFFVMYVLDVIEELPDQSRNALAEFFKKHPTICEEVLEFGTMLKGQACGDDWRPGSKLSDTIETAIWDLWTRNSSIAREKGVEYHPRQFALGFVDNYYAEGSRVDVWEGNALAEARQRISLYREAR